MNVNESSFGPLGHGRLAASSGCRTKLVILVNFNVFITFGKLVCNEIKSMSYKVVS